eukprot:gene22375-40546_t
MEQQQHDLSVRVGAKRRQKGAREQLQRGNSADTPQTDDLGASVTPVVPKSELGLPREGTAQTVSPLPLPVSQEQA